MQLQILILYSGFEYVKIQISHTQYIIATRMIVILNIPQDLRLRHPRVDRCIGMSLLLNILHDGIDIFLLPGHLSFL